MLLALVAGQAVSAKSLLNDAWTQFDHANTLSMTMVFTSEEHRWPMAKDETTKFTWRKGGFVRMEGKNDEVDILTPKVAYTYRPDKKIYQVDKPASETLEMVLGQLGIHAFHAAWPVLGNPTPTVWHNFKAIRIERDARQEMTPETKLYDFVDPKTHLPIGVSANLGSITQVVIFKDIKLNPKVPAAVFQFTPPKDWKRVTAKTGGWH